MRSDVKRRLAALEGQARSASIDQLRAAYNEVIDRRGPAWLLAPIFGIQASGVVDSAEQRAQEAADRRAVERWLDYKAQLDPAHEPPTTAELVEELRRVLSMGKSRTWDGYPAQQGIDQGEG